MKEEKEERLQKQKKRTIITLPGEITLHLAKTIRKGNYVQNWDKELEEIFQPVSYFAEDFTKFHPWHGKVAQQQDGEVNG
ncbi:MULTISPECIES: hypothetical protein [unclassified Archaeoglobus]|jgi:hypothetical protein|uniref:hypothetical protein n=1 Tax=unclassified Archaeoglobus TaxID=2643606 RepID=UPI0025C43DEF|nr:MULTISPECIES: hypothetical protein [unclassified Archaeoglobus]